MAKHSALWDKYGQQDSDTGLKFLTCGMDTCNGRHFYTAAEFKSHMQRKHGGLEVSSSDVEPIEAGQGDSAADTPGGRPASTTSALPEAPKPKKLSAKARELNDKLNEAINLCIKHFIDGLTEGDTERLSVLRGEVSTAVIGVEFDFEQRLFAVSGKIALAITVAALYVLPRLPTLKQMAAKSKEKAAANATE